MVLLGYTKLVPPCHDPPVAYHSQKKTINLDSIKRLAVDNSSPHENAARSIRSHPRRFGSICKEDAGNATRRDAFPLKQKDTQI